MGGRRGVRAASGGEMPRGGEARQRVGKLFAIERFDQKAVHSGLKTGVTILHQRVRGQRQDWRVAAGLTGLVGADLLGGGSLRLF